jgi:hypothetical protein
VLLSGLERLEHGLDRRRVADHVLRGEVGKRIADVNGKIVPGADRVSVLPGLLVVAEDQQC